MIKSAVYSSLEIANALGVPLHGENAIIDGITIDSREKGAQSCFFAIKGEKYDGANFINQAVSNGARLIVTDRKISLPVSVIYVNDTKIALGKLGKYHKGNTKIIGVTGSVGKTTVKNMIKCVLAKKYNVLATYLNHNNEIGVPLTLLSLLDEEYCIVEMGMRQAGEIRYLSSLCEPVISVITNCESAHIERLGSKENIFKAKTEILENTKKYAVVPSEKRFSDVEYGKVKPYFIGENGNISAKNVTYGKGGIYFDVCDGNIMTKMRISSYGIHDAKNAAFAYAVAKLCDVDASAVTRAIAEYSSDSMRGGVLKVHGITVIDDCYNASFESTKSALLSLSEYAKKNKLTANAMLGDMLEAGEYSYEYHYRIGELAKDIGIKRLYSVGKFADALIDGFCGGERFSSDANAAKTIISELGCDDVLLVKASRAMRLEKIIDYMKESEK